MRVQWVIGLPQPHFPPAPEVNPLVAAASANARAHVNLLSAPVAVSQAEAISSKLVDASRARFECTARAIFNTGALHAEETLSSASAAVAWASSGSSHRR